MRIKKQTIVILCILAVLSAAIYVYAAPIGPTATYVRNGTKNITGAATANYTGNNTDYPYKAGGFIFTVNLNSVQQNDRWKAFVGNVSGTLTLDDNNGYTIYDWALNSTTGQVFATRSSGTINWTGINCSYLNATIAESYQLNHTSNPNDNISVTFNRTNNTAFYVGSIYIVEDTCPSLNTYINNTGPTNEEFEEVLLYDGPRMMDITDQNLTDKGFSNIIYTAVLEQDHLGYAFNESFDFQMIVPENALSTWTSSTPYYFYVELD